MPTAVVIIATIINTLLLTLIYMRRFRGLLNRTYQMNPLSLMAWMLDSVLASIFLAVSGNFIFMVITLLALIYQTIALVLSIVTMRGRKREWKITHSDYICFALAILAAALYYLTNDAMIGATILFIGGVFGEMPQLRKAYVAPKTDQLNLYVIATIRALVGICALQQLNYVGLVQTLFWAVLDVFEIGWIVYCQNRRRWQIQRAVKYAINFCPVEIEEPRAQVNYSKRLAGARALARN